MQSVGTDTGEPDVREFSKKDPVQFTLSTALGATAASVLQNLVVDWEDADSFDVVNDTLGKAFFDAPVGVFFDKDVWARMGVDDKLTDKQNVGKHYPLNPWAAKAVLSWIAQESKQSPGGPSIDDDSVRQLAKHHATRSERAVRRLIGWLWVNKRYAQAALALKVVQANAFKTIAEGY